jgi:hypothetical protein
MVTLDDPQKSEAGLVLQHNQIPPVPSARRVRWDDSESYSFGGPDMPAHQDVVFWLVLRSNNLPSHPNGCMSG